MCSENRTNHKNALRPEKQAHQLNRSVWNVHSGGDSSSSLVKSIQETILPNAGDNNIVNSDASFLYSAEVEYGKPECLVEGWDIVEHPTLPPPPSQAEDVEHWMRAMFIDATKK